MRPSAHGQFLVENSPGATSEPEYGVNLLIIVRVEVNTPRKKILWHDKYKFIVLLLRNNAIKPYWLIPVKLSAIRFISLESWGTAQPCGVRKLHPVINLWLMMR